MLTELSGQIERITFSNEDNGFTIARVRVHGRRDLVTIVGNLISPMPGEVLHMKGTWANHPKFGEQFKVDHYEITIPATVFGIKKYLGSGLIKGIGPVMADRIVKRFGKNALDIIENHIHRLAEIEGIGKKRINMIQIAWDEQRDVRDVMMFLQSHGVSTGYAAKIYKAYGKNAVAMVLNNPFQLAMDVRGIGFVTADKIAEQLGFEKTSEKRLEAGIIHVLEKMSEDGHVYYPQSLLYEKCSEILQVDSGLLEKPLTAIKETKKIVVEDFKTYDGKRERQSNSVFLSRYHVSETGIARFLLKLTFAKLPFSAVDAKKAIKWVEPQLGIFLAASQVDAILLALSSPVMVLTGGPGTGKTTIINAILKIYVRLKLKVMMAAPTGRAAKRITETTGAEAKTIHRMLEYSIQSGGFQKNEDNPLACDVLIVDEVSMIDTVLMYHLLKAVKPGTILIFVGDVNQLPSVGAGNVLNDIIQSKAAPVVVLNEIFRQAQTSKIIINAHRINSGHLPVYVETPSLTDFYFIEQEDPEKVLDIILEMIKMRIPKRFGFDATNDIQVLTPMHKGLVGTSNFNTKMQEALNPKSPGIMRGGMAYRVGDKVMQIKNNYDKDIFNGDIGRIFRIFPEEQEVIVDFEDRKIVYEFSELDELTLAYAVSIHKSQGSEYPAVVIPILTQHYILLQRNLLYTAVTRGKKLVVLVGTKKAMAIAVKNNTPQKRFTYLKERLSQNRVK